MKHLAGAFFLVSIMITCVEAAEEAPLTPTDFSTIQVLDLQTAQKIALKGNPDMAAAMSRVEQARARVKQAVAAWWPRLDVTWSGNRTRLSDDIYDQNQALAHFYGQSADRTTDNYSAGAQATWILFDGFYRSFKQQQATFNEKTLTAAHKDSQRLLINGIAEAFLNAQLAQTNVDIATADNTFYTSQLRDAQNRYDVGVGSWGDVLNIKVQLNSAKTSLLLNQRQFEAAGYGLAALMGIPAASFPPELRLAELDKDFSINTETRKDPEALIAEALAIRPDIQRLKMLGQEAEAGSGQAKSPFYPRVQLVGAVNGARQGDVSLTGEDFGNMVGMNVAWNLFSGGGDRARLFEAKQKEREVAYTLASLRNKVAAEVRQNLALLAAAEEQVRLQRDSVELVKENRDLAKNEYEAGEASLVRLNEAQRDLTTTYSRLAQALVGYHLARHRLLAATGKNLQPFTVGLKSDN
jgi:outer membrane protein TolC